MRRSMRRLATAVLILCGRRGLHRDPAGATRAAGRCRRRRSRHPVAADRRAFPDVLGGKEILYTGSSDGALFASPSVDGSGVASWTRVDALPIPNRAVSSIALDVTEETGNTAIAAFSGFEASTPATPGHLFLTTNGLSGTPIWTNISGNLPDVPLNAIVIDYVGHSHHRHSARCGARKVLYAASDIGVFRSRDLGASWKLVSKGLPFVSVFGLERNATTGQIVASTHGRGMFELHKDDD